MQRVKVDSVEVLGLATLACLSCDEAPAVNFEQCTKSCDLESKWTSGEFVELPSRSWSWQGATTARWWRVAALV